MNTINSSFCKDKVFGLEIIAFKDKQFIIGKFVSKKTGLILIE